MPVRKSPKKAGNGKFKKLIGAFLAVILLSLLIAGWELYQKVYVSNVKQNLPKDTFYLEIPSGSDFNQLRTILSESNFLNDMASFEWVAQRLNYTTSVKAGRYRIEKGMSNFEMVRLLASGRQEPVRLVINRFRSRNDFFAAIGRRLEADSAQIAALFNDEVYLRAFGFNPENSMAVVIPNTYEFYWNTSANSFFERMHTEYNSFWNQTRKQKARELGLKPIEVMILASIVDEETNKDDEKGQVAGVYLNRMKINMPLQADPTVRFAHQDFSIKRVTGKHLRLQSAYNTYQVNGLPPGPICTPAISSIDAVLNSKPHNYLYFCAKEDFSGYHRFAVTYREHQQNARLYQQALNKLNIN
jgi:UPF0755 protein